MNKYILYIVELSKYALQNVSLDDLDEKLFEDAIQFEKQQPTIFSTTKQFSGIGKTHFQFQIMKITK